MHFWYTQVTLKCYASLAAVFSRIVQSADWFVLTATLSLDVDAGVKGLAPGSRQSQSPPEVFVHGYRLMGELARDHTDARGIEPLVTPVLVAHDTCMPAQSQHPRQLPWIAPSMQPESCSLRQELRLTLTSSVALVAVK